MTLHHPPTDFECLPLLRWAAERDLRQRKPATLAGRHLARRGIPQQRADLLAELAGLGGSDRR